MRPNFKYFQVGDVVQATSPIWRRDKRTILLKGDKATVSRIYQTDENSPQIIWLEVEDKMPIGDLVCFENLPLELAART